MTKTESIHTSFEKAVSEERPFMVYRIPGKEIELADLNGQTNFIIKPWQGGAFSLQSSNSSQKSRFQRQTSKEGYRVSFAKYMEAFQSGNIQKAILSSIIQEEKPKDFDPIDYFFRLCESYPNAFAYLLYHPSLGTWCGASPEILLEGSGDEYSTVALAGTQPTNPSQEYDWGEKEVEEHELVNEHIRAILEKGGATEIRETAPYTIQAANVVHLKTDFRFKYGKSVRSLLDQLHPTPAVAGLPTAASIELIQAAEKHDRGLYTGYLGILSESETRVFVNLRCMQIGERDLALYAGGGITAKSDMEAEWMETRLKAKTLLNLLKSTT
ncbi:isochorismate synthase [Cryomorphaceae bacterium 1068]|nr:isochorismate synthase [Cryomorphaceae bacterium 1068]